MSTKRQRWAPGRAIRTRGSPVSRPNVSSSSIRSMTGSSRRSRSTLRLSRLAIRSKWRRKWGPWRARISGTSYTTIKWNDRRGAAQPCYAAVCSAGRTRVVLPADDLDQRETRCRRVPRRNIWSCHAAVVRAGNESEAVALANQSRFGLGASIWTTSVQRANRVALQIESGMVFVNSMTRSDSRLPFGGIKASGYGRELWTQGIRSFTNVKTVCVEGTSSNSRWRRWSGRTEEELSCKDAERRCWRRPARSPWFRRSPTSARKEAARSARRSTGSATWCISATPGDNGTDNQSGVVVLDADKDYSFVKRISYGLPASKMPGPKVSGIAVSVPLQMLYVTTNGWHDGHRFGHR